MSSALLLATLLSSNPSEYPLAAAFAVNGKLMLVELHEHAARILPTAAFAPTSADLSRDRKAVVFAATPPGEKFQQVYLQVVEGGTPLRLDLGLAGHLRDPRFSPDGKALYLASANTEAGGPEHPTKLWKYDLASKKVSELSAPDSKLCRFNPAQLGAELLHVGTDCYVDYELFALDVAGKKTRTLARVTSATTELAASFDGKTAVYTTRTIDGTVLWVVRGTEKPKALTTFNGLQSLLQPRFVCPRDVVVLVGDRFQAVNSKTGEITEVASLVAATEEKR